MLAHVGHHQRVAAGQAPEIVDHVRGVQVAVVRQVLNVADRDVALERLDVRQAIMARDRPAPRAAAIRPAPVRKSPAIATSTRTFLFNSARSMSLLPSNTESEGTVLIAFPK